MKKLLKKYIFWVSEDLDQEDNLETWYIRKWVRMSQNFITESILRFWDDEKLDKLFKRKTFVDIYYVYKTSLLEHDNYSFGKERNEKIKERMKKKLNEKNMFLRKINEIYAKYLVFKVLWNE